MITKERMQAIVEELTAHPDPTHAMSDASLILAVIGISSGLSDEALVEGYRLTLRLMREKV